MAQNEISRPNAKSQNFEMIKSLSILQIFVSLIFAVAFVPFFSASNNAKFVFIYFALSYFAISAIRAFKFKIFFKNSNKANLFKIFIIGIALISLYWILLNYIDYTKKYIQLLIILPILGFLLVAKAHFMSGYADFKISAFLQFFYLLFNLFELFILLDDDPVEHAIAAAGAVVIFLNPLFFLFVFFIEAVAEFLLWKRILKI